VKTATIDQLSLDLFALPGYEPALPLQPQEECGGCDGSLKLLDANGEPAPDIMQPLGSLPRATVTHAKGNGGTITQWVDACQTCWDYGYRTPPTPTRAEIVIANCLEHAANGVGLQDAAAREGYAKPAFLDSVLRRWGRRDISGLLFANEDAAR